MRTTLLMATTTTGKRNGLSLNAANDYGLKTRRLFVTDKHTKINFRIGTGADVFIQKNLFKNNYINQIINFLLPMEQ